MRWQTTLNERDGESGLDWRGARMYDAEYGNFLSVDPLWAKFPGMGGYVYSDRNPISFTDANGMSATNFNNENGNLLYHVEDGWNAVPVAFDKNRQKYSGSFAGWDGYNQVEIKGLVFGHDYQNIMTGL
ncbi:MAG: hypothetical protein H6581_25530 [Bacteroidia bacterium]|nr:hypothetical protein [Bacteroidia bacterium]